jgi:hypothetical protein
MDDRISTPNCFLLVSGCRRSVLLFLNLILQTKSSAIRTSTRTMHLSSLRMRISLA